MAFHILWQFLLVTAAEARRPRVLPISWLPASYNVTIEQMTQVRIVLSFTLFFTSNGTGQRTTKMHYKKFRLSRRNRSRDWRSILALEVSWHSSFENYLMLTLWRDAEEELVSCSGWQQTVSQASCVDLDLRRNKQAPTTHVWIALLTILQCT